MFFLVLSIASAKRLQRIEENWNTVSQSDDCRSISDVPTALKCAVSDFPPIAKVTTTEFGQCVLGCRAQSSGRRIRCLRNCTTLKHPAPASKSCVLSCSDISDPLHQTQCLDKCRSTSRFNPANDFSDACDRCVAIVKGAQRYIRRSREVTAEVLRKGIMMACPTSSKLMPFCQSISEIGIDELVELILKKADATEICSKISLC